MPPTTGYDPIGTVQQAIVSLLTRVVRGAASKGCAPE
jgi:hypothetical protein